jgi:hypothetical protein
VAGASVNLLALASRVEALPRSGMIAAAKTAKRIVEDEGKRIAGADGLVGTKRRGVKLRARDDIRPTSSGATCRVQGSIPGWVWVSNPIAPHLIRRRKRGPLRKMTVAHPGVPGGIRPGAWGRVAERIAEVVPQVFADELGRVIRG